MKPGVAARVSEGRVCRSSGTEAESTNAYAAIARSSIDEGLFAAFDVTPAPSPTR
jgi:hypothetical protein